MREEKNSNEIKWKQFLFVEGLDRDSRYSLLVQMCVHFESKIENDEQRGKKLVK